MKFVSALVTAAAGKIRGLVASHNKGGAYFRGKTIPVNPRSAAQVAQRSRLQVLVERFRTVVTAAQRAAWDTFSKNVTRIDRLGNVIKVSGNNWYLGGNALRSLCGTVTNGGSVVGTFVDAGPTNFAVAQLSTLSGTVYAGASTMAIGWTQADEWNSTTSVGGTGAVAIFVSKPQNSTRNYWKGPYRFCGIATSIASAGTAAISLPAGYVTGGIGSQQFIKAQAVNADGRYSGPQRFRLTA